MLAFNYLGKASLVMFVCKINYNLNCRERWRHVDSQSCARNYRPSFRGNKPKTLVLYDWKRAFWAGFRENWVYKFGHWKDLPKYKNSTETVLYVTYLVLKLQLGEMIKWKHCKIMWHHRVLRQHRHTNSIRNIKNIRNIRNFEVTKFREHPYCTGPWELGLGPYGFLVPVCDRRL